MNIRKGEEEGDQEGEEDIAEASEETIPSDIFVPIIVQFKLHIYL